jgi:hypothetical protein
VSPGDHHARHRRDRSGGPRPAVPATSYGDVVRTDHQPLLPHAVGDSVTREACDV